MIIDWFGSSADESLRWAFEALKAGGWVGTYFGTDRVSRGCDLHALMGPSRETYLMVRPSDSLARHGQNRYGATERTRSKASFIAVRKGRVFVFHSWKYVLFKLQEWKQLNKPLIQIFNLKNKIIKK